VLDQGRLEVGDAVRVAAQIARALGELHKNHIVHKNVEPANILVNLEAGEAKLTNFEIASRLDRESARLTNANRIEGELAYISPEQTGRMNRSVDYRTDFYSLGVTLYEMLTGRVPFDTTDPVGLAHAHIAVPPVSPSDIRPSVPPALSEVVLKLLAKNAEDRYQSAFGLVADLQECLSFLVGGLTLIDFSPGKNDVATSFQVPQKLYGRDQEKEALVAAFERASHGATELCLVAGNPGVGKSALVAELIKPITRERGYLVAGKFDQRENVPYGAFIQAFRALIREILAEREERIAVLRDRIQKAVGASGRLVCDVIPDVERIIGTQPAVAPLGPAEAQNRFNVVLQQFLGVFAQREHPLAIFLDDLQWADAASLGLIQILLRDPKSRYLFLIGAYRDSEVPAGHPLALALAEMRKGPAAVHEIEVRPLVEADVARMVGDALASPVDGEVRALGSLVFQKTEGNPFFVNQFLSSLHARGLVSFDADLGKWQWDLSRIKSERITDNVAQLMADKIGELPPAAQRALELAACIGSSFDLPTLAGASGRSRHEMADDLWPAAQVGLVVPIGDAYRYAGDGEISGIFSTDVEYAFLHDRVQEAAYARLTPEVRKEAHLRVGRLLLAATGNSGSEARIFDIVGHLDRSLDLVTHPAERLEIARLNLAAGQRAKNANAYDAATRYLTAGIGLLPADPWETAYALAFALHKERAECAHLSGRFDDASADFDLVLSRARERAERAEIHSLRMMLAQSRGDFAGAVKIGVEALALYDVVLPPREELGAAIGPAIGGVQGLLAERKMEDLVDAPEIEDPEERTRVKLLALTLSYGAYSDPQLFQLLAPMLVQRSLTKGHAPFSAIGYATYSLIAGPALGNYALGYDLGQLALRVTDKLDGPGVRVTIQFMVTVFPTTWKRPLRASFELLEQTYAQAIAAGDLYIAGISAMQRTILGLMSGEDLYGLLDRAEKYFDFLQRIGQNVSASPTISFHRMMLLLTRSSIPEERAALYDEEQLLARMGQFAAAIQTYWVFSLQRALLFDELDRAADMAARAGAMLPAVFGHVAEPEFRFYHALLLAAQYATTPAEDREARLKTIGEERDRLKVWADASAPNFRHKQLLVEAEIARITGDAAGAMALYDQAIESAAEHHYVHIQALAAELAARFYLAAGRRTVARAYLADARHGYTRWGADAKVAELSRRYADLLPPEAAAAQKDTTDASALDLLTVLRASQAISGEIVLGELLRKLMTTVLENAGAQRGVLVLHGEGQGLVEARQGSSGLVGVVVHQGSFEDRDDLAKSVIRYVERTQETVVLDEAAVTGQFRVDPYVVEARPRSILCLPVTKQQKLLGVLYLENNLVAGAFTPERRVVLEILAAQAAISLENARLYETLEQRVKDRTQELSQSNEDLSRALARLKDTQKRLIVQEKMASLGALTSGIAHEIKNPLNFINNFAESSVGIADELLDEIRGQKARLDPSSVESVEELAAELKGNANKIHEHGRRADDIVRAMLEHSRGGGGERREVDLNALLKEYTNLAYQGFRSQDPSFNVSLEASYDEALAPIEVVPQEIGRVFLNLINNACYAVHAKKRKLGGRFSPALRITTRELGDAVQIRVRDNGMGIPADVKDKIWSPFFTTKPTGEGTGLGLSISYDIIVQGNGGTLDVETEEGEYAEFVVTLPRKGEAEA
jgi:predicted ATPase/signal transduction histidine kinase